MKVVHHLDDATLMRFASGALDEAFAVTVAAHIDLCATCHSALRAAEACGGHLLESSDTAEISENAFDRLRARIEGSEILYENAQPSKTSPEKAHQYSASCVPKPLRRYIGSSLDDVAWSKIAPGVMKRDITLDSQTSNKLYMLHIEAGREMPEHGHCGSELTLVLSGAYKDRNGRFARGDIADLDEHDEHQPKVDGDTPCICLIAAEGHTKPKGLLARLVRPFIGV